MCSHLNPGDQPSLEDVRACIEKNKIKNNEPSRNQATALETYDRRIATGATQNNNQSAVRK